jgi:3-keto-5-aminohexanoate cleavage enzyme
MPKKLIIMARINEYMSRDKNPHVPFTPDEIAQTAVDCEAAGASIIHFHARNPDGSPSYDPATYLEIVQKIRLRSKVLIDSTLGQNTIKGDENRSAHIVEMGKNPEARADMAAVDVGSTNIDAYDWVNKRFFTTDRTYVNTIQTCMFLAERMHAAGVKPHLTCWTIPFLRTAEALMDMGVFREPSYVQFTFCEGGIIGGHPCTIDGALAFANMLPLKKKTEWTVTCKEGNLLPAAAVALERGGHVSPGIGDYTYPELGYPTNAKLVEFFANLGRAFGREIASPAETRVMLGLSAPQTAGRPSASQAA